MRYYKGRWKYGPHKAGMNTHTDTTIKSPLAGCGPVGEKTSGKVFNWTVRSLNNIHHHKKKNKTKGRGKSWKRFAQAAFESHILETCFAVIMHVYDYEYSGLTDLSEMGEGVKFLLARFTTILGICLLVQCSIFFTICTFSYPPPPAS